MSFCKVLIGNLVLQVEQTGTGWQKTEDMGVSGAKQGKEGVQEGVLTGQTDGTDKTNINNIFVTETRCTKVDFVLCGNIYGFTDGWWGQKSHLWPKSDAMVSRFLPGINSQ